MTRGLLLVLSIACVLMSSGEAQAGPLDRNRDWDRATNALSISAGVVEMLMPRVFYSDPEVTVGWKARWHVSVLAPTMTLAAVGFLNEEVLKDAFEGRRPGCNDTNEYLPQCAEYGMLSTQSFYAFSTFGQGAGVFLVDTFKWSDGQLNAGSLVGHVAVPLVLGTVTTVGRTAGNWETAGQAWGSAGIGTLVGLGMGVMYGLMQRPECGYTGDLICW